MLKSKIATAIIANALQKNIAAATQIMAVIALMSLDQVVPSIMIPQLTTINNEKMQFLNRKLLKIAFFV